MQNSANQLFHNPSSCRSLCVKVTITEMELKLIGLESTERKRIIGSEETGMFLFEKMTDAVPLN